MEAVIARAKPVAIATVKAVAITLTFAVAYFVLTRFSPIPAMSGMLGAPLAKAVRLANALRAFVLVTPYAAIGTFLGSFANNATFALGNVMTPTLTLGVGLVAHRVARRFGGTAFRDITILALYGAVAGAVVAVSNGGLALLLGMDVAFWSLLAFKVGVNAVIYASGYSLVRAWRYARRPR